MAYSQSDTTPKDTYNSRRHPNTGRTYKENGNYVNVADIIAGITQPLKTTRVLVGPHGMNGLMTQNGVPLPETPLSGRKKVLIRTRPSDTCKVFYLTTPDVIGQEFELFNDRYLELNLDPQQTIPIYGAAEAAGYIEVVEIA